MATKHNLWLKWLQCNSADFCRLWEIHWCSTSSNANMRLSCSERYPYNAFKPSMQICDYCFFEGIFQDCNSSTGYLPSNCVNLLPTALLLLATRCCIVLIDQTPLCCFQLHYPFGQLHLVASNCASFRSTLCSHGLHALHFHRRWSFQAFKMFFSKPTYSAWTKAEPSPHQLGYLQICHRQTLLSKSKEKDNINLNESKKH